MMTLCLVLYSLLYLCTRLTTATGVCTSAEFSRTDTSATHIDATWFNSACYGANTVNVSHNEISSMDNDTFGMMWAIRTLDMSWNNISVIPTGIFAGMRNCESLDLSHNKIISLSLDFFFNKDNLISVDLSYNIIEAIPLAVFNHSLGKLKSVDITYNQLKAAEPWAYFNTGSNIQKIDARFNNISTFTNLANWTYDGRSIYEEALTDLRNNSFRYWDDDFFMQYKVASRDVGIDTLLLELFVDARDNNWICDCKMHHFAMKVTESMYKWSNNDLLFIKCYDPPELRDQRLFFDIPLGKFVCNVTEHDDCPAGCLCQDRPEEGVINVDCRSRNLTEAPSSVPYSKYGKITLQLDHNNIRTIGNLSYADQLYSLTVSNNALTSVNSKVIEDIAKKEVAEVDLRNNELERIPEEISNIQYQFAKLSGNNFVCDCDMLWMKDWISLAPKYEDKSLNCTFKGSVYKIIDLDEGLLECSQVGSIILIVVLTIVLFAVIALIVTAKRCPYETKVLIFKIFRIHPADKYVVDESEGMEFDTSVSYDDNDPYVSQWVKRVLVKQLEEKKPKYRLAIPIRNMSVGPEADCRLDLIDRSKRLLIILSKNYDRHRWCDYESCHAETLEQNSGRILYILYDREAENLSTREPWVSKLKDRKVFTIGERMFWSKLRYELPRKSVRQAN